MGDPFLDTVHLVALGEDNLPMGGIGSACLLQTSQGMVLLGVKHVTDNHKRWALHIEYKQGQGSANFVFSAPTYFTRFGSSSAAVEPELDFFVVPVELPRLPRHQKWESRDVLSVDAPKRVFNCSDLTEPSKSDRFEFAGLVKPLLVQSPWPHAIYENTLVEFRGLTLEAIDREKLVFKLPGKHPGHEWFRGTSGAAITNQNGQLVALVTGGCDEANVIFGFPVLTHLPLIEATLSKERSLQGKSLE